jgi:hypothetical protein
MAATPLSVAPSLKNLQKIFFTNIVAFRKKILPSQM